MDILDVKSQMMDLWKRNFGDSDDYISLVFDNYFDPDLICYKEEEGRIVSALLGVPYMFADLVSKDKIFNGLYLCGLSTDKKYRGRGLISDLIEKINIKAKEKEFDFTFLIPQGDGLRQFYRDRGYADSFYKVKERYASNHNFLKNNPVIDYVETEVFSLKTSISADKKHKIISYLKDNEIKHLKGNKGQILLSILHSKRDWEIVLDEALKSREKVVVAFEKELVKGVIFAKCDENKQEIKVKKIITVSVDINNILFDAVMKCHPEYELEIERDLEIEDFSKKGENEIWEPFYAQNNTFGAEYENVSVVESPASKLSMAKPYGMCRILNLERILKKLGYNYNEIDLKELNEKEINAIIFAVPSLGKIQIPELFNLPTLIPRIYLLLE